MATATEEKPVAWENDPLGRRVQLSKRAQNLVEKSSLIFHVLQECDARHARLRIDNEKELGKHLSTAVDSCLQVVDKLLLIKDGTASLSREKFAPHFEIQRPIGHFKILRKVAEHHLTIVGEDMVQSMEYGDLAEEHVRNWKSLMKEMERELVAIAEALQAKLNEKKALRETGETLRKTLRSAEDQRDDAINGFLSFFSEEKCRGLESAVSCADERVQKNQMLDEKVCERINELQALKDFEDEVYRHAASEEIRASERNAEYFDQLFKRLTDYKTEQGEMWARLDGLLESLEGSDYTATRDKSLRAILQTLEFLHEGFDHKAVIEKARIDVHRKINHVLGPFAADNLLESRPVAYLPTVDPVQPEIE
ncbi:hypothetical protein K432DRAFT_430163 [Lepidopterella palustris CBS 459.81]|uniref:Uncharacterized protein n=1 Tax=Lepidopterella palustris CBS 459.81 TaxID=1314670 RepID=A0A8E2J9G2_9PEZI|nr:hypothetical protein K432DRAFT_430163 [Lepidopterella palustris CBS 459.81]